MCARPYDKYLQVAALGLFAFDGFEECFEIALAERAAALALDDFVEERGPVSTGRVKICSM
jgi:hypothetical protein